MLTAPEDLRRNLKKYGQEHALAFWDQLADNERQALLDQLRKLDLEQLQQLYSQAESTLVPMERIEPIPVVRLDADNREPGKVGEEALRRGEVAVLLVAGGQGSRLGFEHPKGMYPIGPVSKKSLFQIHAEKVLALCRRYGCQIPFLVMTSPINRAETQAFFEQHGHFGLPGEEVVFFNQGTMPALDMTSGRLLLEARGRLFTSPNGHGGSLTALAENGLLDRLRQRNIKQVFYFQVDNPLVKVADPVFIGQHRAAGARWARWLTALWPDHSPAGAEVSSKVLPKAGPADKLGNLVLVNGRCTIIEYSDLPQHQAAMTDEKGGLRFWAGSPAIHIFDVDFLGRVTQGETRIPFHVARKKVPYVNATGAIVKPEKENALKFEMFIFDVLPRAERWTVVETSRPEEFEPLKNATGADSPESVHQAMSNLYAGWLEKAGIQVPRRANGQAAVPLEISPLFALDAEELAARVNRGLKIQGPTYLE